MQQLNKVQLCGNVGNNIYLNTVGARRVIRFSLATNIGYRASDGTSLTETTWHSVTAWEDEGELPDLSLIQKGMPLEVTGRIRNSKYTGSDGVEHYSYEIIASKITLLDEALTPQD